MELLEARGLDAELCVRLDLQTASAPDGGGDWISIPFVKGGAVVNHKYRRVTKSEGGQNFAQDKGGAQVFWNYDAITDPTLARVPLVITEGEFDAMASIQSGFARSVSVPGGAPQQAMGDKDSGKYAFVADSLDDLADVTDIILAVDGDGPGVALMNDEKPRLVADLGAKNFFMLRNHGLLTVAPTIPDAFQLMYIFEAACTIQVRAQAGGELIPIPQAIIDNAAAQSRQVTRGQGGQLSWPGVLRRLQRRFPGFDS